MLDFRPILFVIGLLLATLAVAMAVPLIADALIGHPDWQVFAASAVITLFVGIALALTNRVRVERLSIRQAFVLTTASWLTVAAFAALPLALADIGLSFTDAFFEAMSGITTTGSTVIAGLDGMPVGILLWRALLQWLGGIGIVVTAIAILPLLRIGGMQLFRMESSDRAEKAFPRLAQVAGGVVLVYVGLTVSCAILLGIAGFGGVDAIAHALSSVATGGYSTKDASVGHFDNLGAEVVIMVFMVAGALPLVLYVQAVRGRPLVLWRDEQVRGLIAAILCFIVVVAWFHSVENDLPFGQALREAAFNVVSIGTTTGFATADYGAWGTFSLAVFFVLMFMGGCTGSTAGSVKMFRYLVLFSFARTQMRRMIAPKGVFIPHFNHRPIPEDVAVSVMSFFYLFIVSFAALAIALGVAGLDFLTALSGAATAVTNVGPGLGPVIGPAGNFSTLPDAAKWLLAAGMLLGRLELFTVLILFTRSFWRG